MVRLWHWLVNLYIWLTISSFYGSFPLALGLIGRDSGLSTLLSWLWVCLSAEGAKNVSCPWLSSLRGCRSLTMALTGKFAYMAHHFILLRLNPFGLRVDREGWWFEHSMSWLRVCLSAEGAKNVSWPRLSPLRGCGSLTMASTSKFVYMAHHLILLWLSAFGLRVDTEGWWFEHSFVMFSALLVSRGC